MVTMVMTEVMTGVKAIFDDPRRLQAEPGSFPNRREGQPGKHLSPNPV